MKRAKKSFTFDQTNSTNYIFTFSSTATISPLDLSRPLYPSLTLMVPTSCAVIVLIVIIIISLLLIFKSHSSVNLQHHNHQSNGTYDETGVTCGEGLGEQSTSGREERLLSTNGILTLLGEPNGKESSMGSEFCETPSKLYYPTPYATNHIDYSTMQVGTPPPPAPPPPPPPSSLPGQGSTLNKSHHVHLQQQHAHLNVHLHPPSSASSTVLHSIHHHHIDSNEVIDWTFLLIDFSTNFLVLFFFCCTNREPVHSKEGKIFTKLPELYFNELNHWKFWSIDSS